MLSHRWGADDEEQTFKDFQKGRGSERQGHKKIVDFCAHARGDGLEWGWVDTCCIDKRSSAELSESINSMFQWYQRADRCYIYMIDADMDLDNWKDSIWWTRGWTLQELIAPRRCYFYDRDWNKIGSRLDLATEIASVTTIPINVLAQPGYYKHWSVAQKMSWAASRQTKRPEDRAYSLLGIFGIHMPLLYGEGSKAFQRLQLEILQKYSDESIFSWQVPSGSEAKPHLVLAPTPHAFLWCREMQPTAKTYAYRPGTMYNQPRFEDPPRPTSWGIKIQADAYRLNPQRPPLMVAGKQHQFLWAVPLVCVWDRRIRALPCTIILVQDGPVPLGYKRLMCIYGEWGAVSSNLARDYVIGDVENDRRFYLQYDIDFDY